MIVFPPAPMLSDYILYTPKGADSIRLPDNAAKASQPMTTFQRVSLALGAALLFVAAMPILFILVAIIGDITGWYRLENYMNSADH
jgi:hypothetical protein